MEQISDLYDEFIISLDPLEKLCPILYNNRCRIQYFPSINIVGFLPDLVVYYNEKLRTISIIINEIIQTIKFLKPDLMFDYNFRFMYLKLKELKLKIQNTNNMIKALILKLNDIEQNIKIEDKKYTIGVLESVKKLLDFLDQLNLDELDHKNDRIISALYTFVKPTSTDAWLCEI